MDTNKDSESKATPLLKPPLDAKFTSDQQVSLFDKFSAATRAIDKERIEDAERRKWEGIVRTATEVHRAREETMQRALTLRRRMRIEMDEEGDDDGVTWEGEDGQRLGQEGDMEGY